MGRLLVGGAFALALAGAPSLEAQTCPDANGLVDPVDPVPGFAWRVPANGFAHWLDTYGGYHPGEDWNLCESPTSCANTNADLQKPVHAIGNGTVRKVTSLTASGRGYMVVVQHTGSFLIPAKTQTTSGEVYSYGGETVSSFYSIYLHIDTVPATVKAGACVTSSTVLGYIMNPGGGPHLHFEIRHPNQAHSNDWSLVFSPPPNGTSNWAPNCQSSSTSGNGYYCHVQPMIDGGMRHPSEFLAANRGNGDRSLVTADGVAVHWLQDGVIYHVTDPSLIDTMRGVGVPGWDWSLIRTIPSLSPYQIGPDFVAGDERSDGLLLRQRDASSVYVMQNGRRRWVRSPEALDWMGGSWFPHVIDVAPAVLSSYVQSVGSDIYGVGEGEADSAVKKAFAAAYATSQGDANCSQPTSWRGWPGEFATCLDFALGPVLLASPSGASGVAGKYQKFGGETAEKGAIEYSSGGAFVVAGAIYSRYASLGFSASSLGFPISNEYQWGSYRRSDFEGGYIYWDRSRDLSTVVYAAPTCTTFSITPELANPSAGTGSTTVTVGGGPSGCSGGNWTAAGNGQWLTVAPTSGTGPGQVTVSWAANAGASARTANATIATRSFAVTQAGTAPPACTSFSINPGSIGATAAVGSQVVSLVGSPSGCAGGSWSASGNGSWLSVAPTSGSGSGAVTVSWSANASAASRSDNATIAGKAFTVTQAGTSPPACTSFSISPALANPGSTAGSQSVAVNGIPSGCTGGSWTASGNGSWVTVSPSAGSGTGSVTVSWGQNTGTARSGAATIAGNPFTVNQGAAGVASLFVISPNGGENWIEGSTHQIVWTASNLDSTGDIQILYNSNTGWQFIVSGLAPSTTSYAWTLPSAALASTSVWVGNAVGGSWQAYDTSDQPFSISPPCTSFSISPSSTSPGSGGGAQSVDVIGSPAGCAGGNWTASGNGSWITVSANSGSGPGSVSVSWSQNTGAARSDTATIAGHPFTVSQPDATAMPSITLLSPNGGERWGVNSIQQVEWVAANLDPEGEVRAFYSVDDGPWQWIGGAPPASLSMPWVVPGAASGSVRLWIGNALDGAWQAYDQSDDLFAVESFGWTNVSGVSVSADKLSKTAASGWNAGATSLLSLESGDGYAEFTALETKSTRAFGLSSGAKTRLLGDIGWAIYLSSSGELHVYEGGVDRGLVGWYSTGDRLRVAVEGGSIVYRRNGVFLLDSQVEPRYPLLVEAALFSHGATIGSPVLVGARLVENLAWTHASGTSAFGNNLRKTLSRTGWNAGAMSSRALAAGDGYVEMTASDTTKDRLFGLSNGDADTTAEDVDFAIRLDPSGSAWAYEGGAPVAQLGAYAEGDRFRVAVESGAVHYLQNGLRLYSSSTMPAFPLLVDASLYSPGSTLMNATIWGVALVDNVAWASAGGVVASGNSLRKTSAKGWNAGAISKQTLSGGSGYVEFTAAETTTTRAIGLSHGNSNRSLTDIDFALYLSDGGKLSICEGGTLKASPGTYLPGDRLRVSVAAGAVKYWRNGSLLYSSSIGSVYPLQVDTALYTPKATVANVVLGRGVE